MTTLRDILMERERNKLKYPIFNEEIADPVVGMPEFAYHQ
jgi:hypothetical protein